MPDITMCCNIQCKDRFDCYRFMANPSEYRQSYSLFNKQGFPNCTMKDKLYKEATPEQQDKAQKSALIMYRRITNKVSK